MNRLKQWLDNWSPWALRRRIEFLRKDNEYVNQRITEMSHRLTLCVQQNNDRRKCIETLESELQSKENELLLKGKECELEKECAMNNHRKADLMRTEIYAAISLLKEVAKDEKEVF